MTRTVSSAQGAPLGDVIASLRRGEVVVLPTEAIYVAVVRADDEAAVGRLRVAGLELERAARLVPSLGAVEAAGAVFTEPARRLAARYWPGPLVLALDGAEGETRWLVPGHELPRRAAAEAGVPLLAVPAARAGQPDPVELTPAAVVVDPDLAVDSGRTTLAAGPTVVRCTQAGPPEVLEEGFIGAAAAERTAVRDILLVCTGNTCRSPMAEGLLRAALAKRLGVDPARLEAHGWRIGSAGVSAERGRAADNAVAVLRERGIDLGPFRSRQLDDGLAERADVIVTMTPGHAEHVLDWWPELASKVSPIDPRGVPDPVGGPITQYRTTADHIAARLEALIDGWLPRPAASTTGRYATRKEPRLSPTPAVPAALDPAALFPRAGEVPPDADLREDPEGDRYLIDGEVRRWTGRKDPVLSVVCDRAQDGTLARREIGRAAMLGADEARAALDAAVRAWDLGRGAWPRATIGERCERLLALAKGMKPLRERVAKLIMWEIGKTRDDANKEFDRTVEYIEATVEALREWEQAGSRFRTEGGVIGRLRRAPLGVTLCMGPFNYPLNETFTILIPALAMGNTAVVKLPKLGMLSNTALLPLLAEHFPRGVVNVIQGDGAELIGPLMTSGKVDVLGFIGSCRVAGIIEKQHPAPYRLQTVLGMEAKNPAIVLPDADLALATSEVVKGALSYNGQRCTGLKLIFVHRSRADDFVARLAAAVDALPVGMPWTKGAKITPLPENGKAEWMKKLVDEAVSKGARVVNQNGGKAAGTLYAPAVVYPVPRGCQLFDNEQFGPVVPVVPYDDIAEVHEAIAQSPFGQQVSVFGQDPAVLGPLVDALANQVCRINLNSQCQRGPDRFPFAGRKSSAEGVLSVVDALLAFSTPALVTTADDAGGRDLMGKLLKGGSSRFLGSE